MPGTPADYAQEIRSWLLARVARQHGDGDVDRLHANTLPHRALLWWLFEGKTYRWLEGSLAASWPHIDRQARRLLRTHNPAWRIVDSVEGETDWLASALASVRSTRPQYITRAAVSGMSHDEHAALIAWLGWIRARWVEYVEAVGPPAGCDGEPGGQIDDSVGWHAPRIRHFAQIARRSRWPLLRNVVAESFRVTIETQELDRLPLPSEPSALFELVCMVRILRELAPALTHLRWLGNREDGNCIDLEGLSCSFQRSIRSHVMLGTNEFDDGLREAVLHYGVRTPQFVDGLVLFECPRAGLSGILVEAKSQGQSYEHAVHQLKCYRAALRAEGFGPLLVWGIIERTDSAPPQGDPPTLQGSSDLWAFSCADDIPAILAQTGLIPELVAAAS